MNSSGSLKLISWMMTDYMYVWVILLQLRTFSMLDRGCVTTDWFVEFYVMMESQWKDSVAG